VLAIDQRPSAVLTIHGASIRRSEVLGTADFENPFVSCRGCVHADPVCGAGRARVPAMSGVWN
jgi:hypothetical protein